MAAMPGRGDRRDDPGQRAEQAGAVDLGGLQDLLGTSARNDCIIQIAIGRFIEV